ncbi:hypothetical protein GIB67_029369 [Kingdonia uniflora]|uniref:Uncharacterized protein n=1 Tax=Kingdonia uniflora TaxID=39325 RepID=A0A7J7NT66_9MAGN|nr:hypothetical protein GIB67_029369 [Kingdonia uniflora]
MDLDTLLRNSQVEIREREAEITALKQQLEDGYGRKAEKSEIVELKAKLSSKNEEIEILKHSQMELRARVYSLQKQKDQVDENFDIVSRESAITSKCLDDLDNSNSTTLNLRDKIERLGNDMETQKVELKQKLQEMQDRWSETIEECKYLKRAYPQLQATAECLIDEYNSVQKLNGELRKQKLQLHERFSSLHANKVKLEIALHDEQAKVKLFETEIHNIQLESGNKLQRLVTELSASKQNQELLVADHEKLQRLLDDVKACEERFKITFNGLELKLSASEYERKQLSEEISSRKIQLQKVV